MIDFKNKKIKDVLKNEMLNYYDSKLSFLVHNLFKAELAQIYLFQLYLRKAEYHLFKRHKIRYAIYLRRKNILGNKLGLSIHCNCFDTGLQIRHVGCIVINGNAKIGKNCILHGGNCIGNKSNDNSLVPIIGDNFEIGFNSVVYGKVSICSNVRIGANSLVNKDITEEGNYFGSPVM